MYTFHTAATHSVASPKLSETTVNYFLRQRFIMTVVCLLTFNVLIVSAANGTDHVGQILYRVSLPSGFSYAQVDSYGQTEVAAQGQVLGSGEGSATNGYFHALLWNEPSGNTTDLTPVGVVGSHAYSTNGTYQVGYEDTGTTHYAVQWSGTAASAVNLNPTVLGFLSSEAVGTNGSQQVGWGSTGLNSAYALLWNGTAASAVNINPNSFDSSYALATNGVNQVGYGHNPSKGIYDHALLWSGTATSAVDLNPDGYLVSQAVNVFGVHQVGYSSNNVTSGDAFLWSGTAASGVDLNPSGFSSSNAVGLNSTNQVGYGTTSNSVHALLWSGTASSAVDLQSFLPIAGDWDSSRALSIDSAGNIFGIAIGDYNGHSGATFAVEWSSGLLAGDFNLDGHINAADIAPMEKALTNPTAYETQYGVSVTELPLIGDVNGDNKFNNADLQELLIALKRGGGSTSVPEPASYILLMFGALILLRRKSIRTSRAAIVSRELVERHRAPRLWAHPLADFRFE